MSNHSKHATPDHDILDVIRERWSPRAFDPARGVARADLLRLFEAARWAPSSFNQQPWRFIVADRQHSPEAFERVFASLGARNQEWAASAPVLVVVALQLVLDKTGDANRHAWYDAGQAVAFLTLQATAIELSLRQMEGFDRNQVRAACGIPETHESAVVMAVGYAGDPDALTSERHRAQERQPRSRVAIAELAFEGFWGKELMRPIP
jgi:nitroreductase